MSMKFFEKPLLPNYVYPCSLDEVQQALTQLPEQDLTGLEAIGLVPATRKDGAAYARYFVKPKSTIYIYSFTATLLFKQPSTVKLSDIEMVYQMRWNTDCKFRSLEAGGYANGGKKT